MVIGIDMDDTICSTNELIIVQADKYDKEVLGGTGVKDESAYEFTEMMGWEKEMKGQFFADRLEYIMDNNTVPRNIREAASESNDLLKDDRVSNKTKLELISSFDKVLSLDLIEEQKNMTERERIESYFLDFMDYICKNQLEYEKARYNRDSGTDGRLCSKII